MGMIIVNGKQYSGSSNDALNVNYNNSESGLESNTVQGAIDEQANVFENTVESDYIGSCTFFSNGRAKRLRLATAKTSMTSGTSYTICTAPERYRPTVAFRQIVVIAASSSSTVCGRLEIDTTGVVTFTPYANRNASSTLIADVTYI